MREKVILLTGPVGSGKTELAHKIFWEMKRRGYKVGGLLSFGYGVGKKRDGYRGLNLLTGEKFEIASIKGDKEWERTGSYFFYPEGLKMAEKAVEKAIGSALLIIDEIGPLEMRGRGLFNVFQKVLKKHKGYILVIVRESLLKEILKMIGEKVRIFTVKKEAYWEILRVLNVLKKEEKDA